VAARRPSAPYEFTPTVTPAPLRFSTGRCKNCTRHVRMRIFPGARSHARILSSQVRASMQIDAATRLDEAFRPAYKPSPGRKRAFSVAKEQTAVRLGSKVKINQRVGRVAEWFKAAVLKTARGFALPRGFESHPFRHGCNHFNCLARMHKAYQRRYPRRAARLQSIEKSCLGYAGQRGANSPLRPAFPTGRKSGPGIIEHRIPPLCIDASGRAAMISRDQSTTAIG
jgi:hypothetical protein